MLLKDSVVFRQVSHSWLQVAPHAAPVEANRRGRAADWNSLKPGWARSGGDAQEGAGTLQLGEVVQHRVDGPGLGAIHTAPVKFWRSTSRKKLCRASSEREHHHHARRALLQLAHDGLQALLVLRRHGLVGLRRGPRLLEERADVAVRQALAEQVAVLAAIVIAAGRHGRSVPAEVQQHLRHSLHMVVRARHGAQHRGEPAAVAQLVVDGAVGDLHCGGPRALAGWG